MTRRARLERKAELRREWADKRRAKASSAFGETTKMLSVIPMGQPILVGHHSERGHRSLLKRADNKMRSACESADMAKHHDSKADGLERQLDRSIFSDDENAVEQLEQKVARLEAERETNNAVNKIIRSKPKNEATPDKLAKLVAIGFSEHNAAELFTPDFCGRIGIPSYVNQNLGGNISAARKRIDQIKARNARTEQAETATDGVLIEGTDYVRVTFAEKPDRSVINELKAAGFRWGGGSWLGYRAKLPESLATNE